MYRQQRRLGLRRSAAYHSKTKQLFNYVGHEGMHFSQTGELCAFFFAIRRQGSDPCLLENRPLSPRTRGQETENRPLSPRTGGQETENRPLSPKRGGRAVKKYVLRRFLQLIPVLIGITFLSFAMMRLAGSDAVQELYSNAGSAVSQEIIDARRAELGLDKPFLTTFRIVFLFKILGAIPSIKQFYIFHLSLSLRIVFLSFCSILPLTVHPKDSSFAVEKTELVTTLYPFDSKSAGTTTFTFFPSF